VVAGDPVGAALFQPGAAEEVAAADHDADFGAHMDGRDHRCSLERTLHGVDVMT
jgi:hypothetical protein